jgi:glycine cleavage system H protein
MNIPQELHYTESHEWIRLENEEVRVGLTDFAQHELTDIVFVELPEGGRVVTAREACCVVESTKVAADIYAPLDGIILEANPDLETHPEWVNESPYEKGWLFRLKPSNLEDIETLKSATEYQELIASE